MFKSDRFISLILIACLPHALIEAADFVETLKTVPGTSNGQPLVLPFKWLPQQESFGNFSTDSFNRVKTFLKRPSAPFERVRSLNVTSPIKELTRISYKDPSGAKPSAVPKEAAKTLRRANEVNTDGLAQFKAMFQKLPEDKAMKRIETPTFGRKLQGKQPGLQKAPTTLSWEPKIYHQPTPKYVDSDYEQSLANLRQLLSVPEQLKQPNDIHAEYLAHLKEILAPIQDPPTPWIRPNGHFDPYPNFGELMAPHAGPMDLRTLRRPQTLHGDPLHLRERSVTPGISFDDLRALKKHPPALPWIGAKENETELERAERIHKAFEKMLTLVNIAGQVEDYVSTKVKTVVKKVSGLVSGEEGAQMTRCSHHH